MSFWHLPRVPEPEEMDSSEEVDSYSSAAADEHLAAIDRTFVEHLIRLLPEQAASPKDSLWALDVGSGPAQIPIMALSRISNLRFVALDRFPNMLACARRNAREAGVSRRLTLLRSDAHSLPFPDHSFSVVISNSVLHHARSPVDFLREIFRVAAPGGTVLVRDLRRPSQPFLDWHLWRHGRHYSGSMRRMFDASVRASYTAAELSRMLEKVGATRANVFRYRKAHIGIERAASQPDSVRDQAPFG
jgi:ubiquinone/menaquinone biosynthesis C-methylase UbiE